jgi:hypothetical protein
MTIADQIDAYLRTQLVKIRVGQTITLLNGTVYAFRTDAGRLVDKQLEYTEHPDDMPSIAFYTGKNSRSFDGETTAELGMENHALEVSVEGFISSDKGGTEGDNLALDIVCALKADPWWGGLLIGMDGFQTETAVQVGDEVYSLVKAGFNAIYTAPFGSE